MRQITQAQANFFICILILSLLLNTIILFNDEFKSAFKKIRENKISSFLLKTRENDLKIFCMILTQPANLMKKVSIKIFTFCIFWFFFVF
jgi:hypothetical protein